MAGLEGTVNVPLAGKQPKKFVVGGVLVVGTATVIYYYRKKKAGTAAAASPASGAAGQYPPDGTTGNPQDPYSTDPATGQTYGDEAAGASSGGAYGAYGSGAASGMYYDPATGAYDLASPYGTGGTGVSPGNPATPGGPPFASNAAWTDWVIQEISAQNPSADTGAMLDAIGVYLQGQVPTTAQRTLIFDARAIAGDPPVPGAGGFPPNVRTSTGPHPQTTEIVPVEFGKTAGEAHNAIVAAHLVPTAAGGQKPSDIVTSLSPPGGSRVPEGSKVTIHAKAAPKPKAPVEISGGPVRGLR